MRTLGSRCVEVDVGEEDVGEEDYQYALPSYNRGAYITNRFTKIIITS